MATIRKRGKRYHAQIRMLGHPPQTKSFTAPKDAQAWAMSVESDMRRGVYQSHALAEHTALAQALHRYLTEVSVNLRSAKSDASRSKILISRLGRYALAALSPAMLAAYRNERLKERSPQTVKHEMGLLNRVLKTAHCEWGIYLPQGIPIVSKPKLPRGRQRRLADGEEGRLLAALGNPVMKAILTFALETAMRRGELAGMRWIDVDLARGLLCIPETKTGEPRTIPLSARAVDTLKQLPARQQLPRRLDGLVFGLRPDSITQAFSRACAKAGIDNLRFHDLRHEATSRLFERGLEMMEVASATGHQDPRMLKRYTHLSAVKLRQKLA